MRTWQKYLLGTVLWCALMIGAGILHTNVFLAGKLTPQQDSELSEKYGMACGVGISLIWTVFFLRRRQR